MTTTMHKTSSNLRGVGFVMLALLIFSLQDIAIKWIGGHYPILEIVIFRTLIAIPGTLLFFYLEGQRGLPTTKRPKLEIVRGFCLFLSFTTTGMTWIGAFLTVFSGLYILYREQTLRRLPLA